MTPVSDQRQVSLLSFLEEAMHLLQRCEVSAWTWWFAGSCPFTIGAVYFVHDMSRSVEAGLHLPVAALWLALAYWWMMLCHAVFADRLLRALKDEPVAPKLSLRSRLRFLASQTFIPATAPWILFLAFLAMLPFGWAYAAYQNFNILALSHFRNGARTRDLLQEAINQSRYRPAQNHGLLAILPALGILVWANLLALIYNTAALSRYFSGDENPISRNPLLIISSGILITTLLATYVITGPLVKALYTLRCFKSLSQRNGDDLAVTFKRAASNSTRIAVLLWLVASPSVTSANTAGDTSTSAAAIPETRDHPVETARIQPNALQQSIHHTLQQSAYQWRLPKPPEQDHSEPGWLRTLAHDINSMLRAVKDSVANFFERLLTTKLKEFLKRIWSSASFKNDSLNTSTPWADKVQLLLKCLLAALTCGVGALFFTHWKKRRTASPAPTSAQDPPVLNLEDEHILATHLPEAEWLNLAASRQTQGDNRQAMRALFLASLAHLGERQLVRVERSKTNEDYLRELSWRARDRLALRQCFSQTVLAFERAWYGTHAVEPAHLEAYRATHQRILSDDDNS